MGWQCGYCEAAGDKTVNQNTSKVCKKCGKAKMLSSKGRRLAQAAKDSAAGVVPKSTNPDGTRNKEYNAKNKADNAEHIKLQKKKYCETNRDKLSARQKEVVSSVRSLVGDVRKHCGDANGRCDHCHKAPVADLHHLEPKRKGVNFGEIRSYELLHAELERNLVHGGRVLMLQGLCAACHMSITHPNAGTGEYPADVPRRCTSEIARPFGTQYETVDVTPQRTQKRCKVCAFTPDSYFCPKHTE